MNINLIYAKSANNVIGNKGDLPWHIAEDLAFFKRITSGSPVIMGSRTWLSLPMAYRPLPGRFNIVLTSDQKFAEQEASRYQDVRFIHSPNKDGLQLALHELGIYTNSEEVFIIGGSSLFEQAKEYATTAYVTEIDAEFVGDVFAPELPRDKWMKVWEQPVNTKSGIPISFCTYKRHI